MIMNEININHDELKKHGIVKVKNFLTHDELQILKNILSNKLEKNHPKSYFSSNLRFLLYKILKFRFLDFKNHLYILKLARNKKLNTIADNYFKRKSYIKFIDSYYSPISDKDVLPWHTDQAYEGDEKNYSGYVNPDHAHMKFFIYLTEIGPDNGCMSYIPGSHKIGYVLREGIFNKKIKYENYYLLKDFRPIVQKNIDYLTNQLDEKFVQNFLKDTEFAAKNITTTKFDYSLSAGDAIIFDEGGVHKGSKSLKNERIVLRYLYSTKKNK